MKTRTIADVVVCTLKTADVGHVRGDGVDGIIEAMRYDRSTDPMRLRHETAAAFAACSEAQITGRLALCAGSSETVPAIATQRPSRKIDCRRFPQTGPQHTVDASSPVCELVGAANRVLRMLERVRHAAVERRGFAVPTIAGDTARARCDIAASGPPHVAAAGHAGRTRGRPDAEIGRRRAGRKRLAAQRSGGAVDRRHPPQAHACRMTRADTISALRIETV